MSTYENCYNSYYGTPPYALQAGNPLTNVKPGFTNEEELSYFYEKMFEALFPDEREELTTPQKVEKLLDSTRNFGQLFLALDDSWNHRTSAFLSILGECCLRDSHLADGNKSPVLQTITDLQQLISTLSEHQKLILGLCSWYDNQVNDLLTQDDNTKEVLLNP